MIELIGPKVVIRPHARRFRARALAASAFVTVLAAVSATGHAQQKVSITFRLADNTTFVETLRLDKTVVQGNEPPRRTLLDAKAHYTVRTTPTGYSVYLKPVKPIDMTVSADAAAMVGGMMTNLRLRYDLDREGSLTNVAGIEQAYSEIENLLPEQFKPVLKIMGLTPATLQQQVVFDWNARSLFFLARNSPQTLPLGQEREVNAPYPSALAGIVKAKGVMRASGPMACGNGRCITWQSEAVSRDPALGKALASYVGGIMAGTVDTYAPPGSRPKLPQMTITEPYERIVLTRVIDVRTGLHQSYTQEHDARGTIVTDGGGTPMPMRVTIRREYTYSY